jgi:hypothetical protein
MSVSMSQAERETFLAGLHVGVLTVARRTRRRRTGTCPWTARR